MDSLENGGIMAGTQASGRPGGNPDLQRFQFTTDREEPCTALLHLRIQPSLLAELKALDGWQEIAREAIAQAAKKAPQNMRGNETIRTESGAHLCTERLGTSWAASQFKTKTPRANGEIN